jgi:hypothetical protein
MECVDPKQRTVEGLRCPGETESSRASTAPLHPPASRCIETADPNLARLVAAWPALPKAIRRMMMALLDRG